jgi:hypothetical protein
VIAGADWSAGAAPPGGAPAARPGGKAAGRGGLELIEMDDEDGLVPSPPPAPRTDRTRLVPPPVLIGHAASHPPVLIGHAASHPPY